MDSNKYYNEERDTIQNWQKYLEETDERNNQMWNTILYNQFVNEEIRRLNKKIYFLKDDIKRISNENDTLSEENNFLKKKEKDVKCKKRKKSDIEIWLSSEKRKKPKNYNSLSDDLLIPRLQQTFMSLNNIDDIINFSDQENRFDYLENIKYEKLYKLIPSCRELKNVIGMEKVKEDVFKQISYFLHGLNNKNEINHVVITGEPGVGKTTLAKIIGKIYLAMGFLNNNNFIEARRSDLIGEYLGQTAVKTQKVIDSAEGGVLFIDEVYSLGNKEKRDMYTKECIDTINLNLTEKGDKFLCIIAGYKEEVQTCFFGYNKGLERRFPIWFELESYSITELKDIFIKFMNDDGWIYNDSIDELLKLIKNNKEILKYQAADLRDIFKLTKENYSMRLLKESLEDGSGDKNIKLEDLKIGFEKFKKNREKGKPKEPEFLKCLYI
tara:strand:- start:1259 stop:2575 length:1317 start_codon:yes stop_codon:yes gene_type:complete